MAGGGGGGGTERLMLSILMDLSQTMTTLKISSTVLKKTVSGLDLSYLRMQ